MKVTRITTDNAEYFEDLIPKELLENEDLFWLGAIAGDGTPCAVTAVGVYEEMAYIEWIYTDPAYRNESAARYMMKSLRVLLKMIEAKVIVVSFSDDCENLEDFLESEGFIIDEDRAYYSVPLIDLIYSETMDRWLKDQKEDNNVFTVSELDDHNTFYDFIRENDIPFFDNEKDVFEYSLVRLDRSKKITGCMMISINPEGDLEIPYFISDGSTEGAIELFVAVKELVTKQGWDERNVIFTDRSGEMIGFLEMVTDETRDHYILTGQKQAVRTI